MAGFSAWRMMIRLDGSPLARAVRIKPELRTSSIEDRVIRAIEAMYEVDRAMTGMMT